MSYKEDVTWQKIQGFLPERNRLTDMISPKEYYVSINGMNVHVDHYEAVSPRGRVILFHGVGGNGRLLSFIAIPLWRAGFDIICPDMPLYGYTHYDQQVTYETWLDTGNEIVKYYQDNELPMFLFGLSAGGMLVYQIACENTKINGIITTCILDQRDTEINKRTARSPLAATIGKPLMALTHKITGRLRIPMKFIGNMRAIVNNQELSRLLMKDTKSSGASVPLSFIYTMLTPAIKIEPEDFNICPFLLVHPGNDLWTDVGLSKKFYDKLACPKELVILEGAGHFPIEPTGLAQMENACTGFLEKHIGFRSMDKK